MSAYKQNAVFEKYTQTDVASLIRKAERNPAEIGEEFLPHVERFPAGEVNLYLVHKGLAEKLGGTDYMEKLKSNPHYIWEKLRENPQMAGLVKDRKIIRKKLPISLIVDAEIAAACGGIGSGPRMKKAPFDYNLALSVYEKDDPFSSSHFQEHAMEKKLER